MKNKVFSPFFKYILLLRKRNGKNETKKIRNGTKRNDMVRETKRNGTKKNIEYQETERNETISLRKRNETIKK
jgi:hypothetical protein